MNKKGFTTIELILTMALVMVLMVTITSVTYSYQEKANEETIKNELINYKNTVTKIIYDDILNDSSNKGKVIKIEKDNNSYKFITNLNYSYSLEIINQEDKVGIKYEGVEYIFPSSKNKLITFHKIETYPTDLGESSVYSLDIYFRHKVIKEQIKIHLVVLK